MSAFDTPNVNKRTLDRFEAAAKSTEDSYQSFLFHPQHNKVSSSTGNRSTVTVDIVPINAANGLKSFSEHVGIRDGPKWFPTSEPQLVEGGRSKAGLGDDATANDGRGAALARGTRIRSPVPFESVPGCTIRSPTVGWPGGHRVGRERVVDETSWQPSCDAETTIAQDDICRCGDAAILPEGDPYLSQSGRGDDHFQGKAPVAHYTHPALEQLARMSPTGCGARVTSSNEQGDWQSHLCRCGTAPGDWPSGYYRPDYYERTRHPPHCGPDPCWQSHERSMPVHPPWHYDSHYYKHCSVADHQPAISCTRNAKHSRSVLDCCRPYELGDETTLRHLARDPCCNTLGPAEYFSPSHNHNRLHLHHHHSCAGETPPPAEPPVHAASPAPVIDIDVPYPVPVPVVVDVPLDVPLERPVPTPVVVGHRSIPVYKPSKECYEVEVYVPKPRYVRTKTPEYMRPRRGMTKVVGYHTMHDNQHHPLGSSDMRQIKQDFKNASLPPYSVYGKNPLTSGDHNPMPSISAMQCHNSVDLAHLNFKARAGPPCRDTTTPPCSFTHESGRNLVLDDPCILRSLAAAEIPVNFGAASKTPMPLQWLSGGGKSAARPVGHR